MDQRWSDKITQERKEKFQWQEKGFVKKDQERQKDPKQEGVQPISENKQQLIQKMYQKMEYQLKTAEREKESLRSQKPDLQDPQLTQTHNSKKEFHQSKKNYSIKSEIESQIDQDIFENLITEKSNFQYKQFYFQNQFSNGQFDLRFDQIKNSLVDQNPLYATFNLMKWKFFQQNLGVPPAGSHLNQELPIQTPLFTNKSDKIKFTWLGHSTAVISFGNHAKFLIDPVFSDRCSPLANIGPQRYRKIPCQVEDLPKIDVVLISHDHYDHLDQNCLKRLHQKNNDTLFIAGLNSDDVLPKDCKKKTLNWTEKYCLQINSHKFQITFVPACHWSRRGINDKNYRLWGGFVIKAPNQKKVFYSGDTGYCGVFKEIGDFFKGFDLSILPIGAYQPRKYLKNQHVNPEEAVKIHLEIKSKKSVGVHWGTFPLGYQHYLAPKKDLQKALQDQKLSKQSFITIDHGGSFEIEY